MTAPRKYTTAAAFRRALEDRLKHISQAEGIDLQRLRRQVAFDRLLARIFSEPKSPWVLKGGYAMELRIKQARATRDIDLGMKRAPDSRASEEIDDVLRDRIQDVVERDPGDYFTFAIGKSRMGLEAAPHGGSRYPVEAGMDGRPFVKFHLDVAIGDPVIGPVQATKGRDWLGFAGIPAGSFPTLQAEQHLAEKIHAYTVPRQTPNSRVRDLLDMVLLVRTGKLSIPKVTAALHAVFDRRKTHPVPTALEPPPRDWSEPYRDLARSCGIEEDIGTAFQEVLRFWEDLKP
ncbi:MAG: nucleotidyl transferase AbiEii/AbiGii toxin family protein [Elusimicrobiota bacterium]